LDPKKERKDKKEKAKEESKEETDDDAEQHGQWIDFTTASLGRFA
jgi:hypothetical protein